MSFHNIIKRFMQIKHGKAGPGQQYTFDPAAQRYNTTAGGGSDMGSKVTFNPAEQKYSKEGMKKGGMVKSSASKRADGCAQRGRTKA